MIGSNEKDTEGRRGGKGRAETKMEKKKNHIKTSQKNEK
jgi:hypothetical protein